MTKLEYSTDSGVSWTTIYSTTASFQTQTDSVSLPVGVNLTHVQVRASAQGDSSTEVDHSIYEIWVEVAT